MRSGHAVTDVSSEAPPPHLPPGMTPETWSALSPEAQAALRNGQPNGSTTPKVCWVCGKPKPDGQATCDECTTAVREGPWGYDIDKDKTGEGN